MFKPRPPDRLTYRSERVLIGLSDRSCRDRDDRYGAAAEKGIACVDRMPFTAFQQEGRLGGRRNFFVQIEWLLPLALYGKHQRSGCAAKEGGLRESGHVVRRLDSRERSLYSTNSVISQRFKLDNFTGILLELRARPSGES